MPRVLVIEDDAKTANAIRSGLRGEGYEASVARTGEDGFFQLNAESFDLVVLDWMLPGRDGIEILKAVRARGNQTPVLLLTARDTIEDRVAGLDRGADDYLVTPMRSVELTARLRAVLRRTAESPKKQQQGDLLVAGPIEIRLKERKVLRHGSPVDLSPIEFRLLTTLVHDIGRAVSHSKLMAHVWGPEYVDCRHYLRLYIKYLRTKIEDDPRNPKLILSEWGVGYRFEPVAA